VTLRWKLVLGGTAILAAILAALLWNSLRLADMHLRDQQRQHVRELPRLLNAALAGPLASRDYATLEDILRESQREGAIEYLALFDRSGRMVARAGSNGMRVPQPDEGTDDGSRDGMLDARIDITVGGQGYGVLRYGLSTRYLETARTALLREGMAIAALGMITAIGLMTLYGFFLTRRLQRLTDAVNRLEREEVAQPLPVAGSDEVATLTDAFNRMTGQLAARVRDLRKSGERFHAIADYTYDLEMWLSGDGTPLWVNPSSTRMLGFTPEECLAMPGFPLALVLEDDVPAARERMAMALRSESGGGFEYRMRRKDGSVMWASATWSPIFDSDGRPQGMRASVRDIGRLHEAEAELRAALRGLTESEAMARQQAETTEQERARLTALLSAMSLGILFADREGRVIYYNPAFSRIWLLRDTDIAGMRIEDAFARSTGVLSQPDDFAKHVRNILDMGEISDTFEIRTEDGRVVNQINHPVRDKEGRFIGHLWIYEDITRERQTAEQMAYLAERDSLTGLFNRHRFQQELARTTGDCDRRGSSCALLFFDLDEFKVVNDNFGHHAGDNLLLRVASEIGALTRHNEILARLGGDEFALLVPDARQDKVVQLAERIVRAVAAIPFRFSGQNLRMTTSVGMAFYPEHAAEAEELVARADAAMYQAKDAGKNTWRMYRSDLESTSAQVASLTWNDRINRALEKNLLRLHFQGVYFPENLVLSHLEALVRMEDETHPGQLIMPGHFVPYAEKSGKILDIDRWVLGEAVRLLAENPAMPPLSVNISGRSFDEPSLPQFVSDRLRKRGVQPRRLVVELTETSAVSDLADAQRFIEALRTTGCGVCLDDFGSGFSSFAYLKHLPVDVVKIDGQFIRGLHQDHDNQVFVGAMVDVAHGLKKEVIAEFVEDEHTLEMLRNFGVDMAQGYFLDTPRADHPALLVTPPKAADS
jgi:diguanylate cyclase (GGDEF)-like protein/PAS domain S-box-containing protein